MNALAVMLAKPSASTLLYLMNHAFLLVWAGSLDGESRSLLAAVGKSYLTNGDSWEFLESSEVTSWRRWLIAVSKPLLCTRSDHPGAPGIIFIIVA